MPLSFAFLCAFLPAEKKKRGVCGRGGRYERRRVGRKRRRGDAGAAGTTSKLTKQVDSEPRAVYIPIHGRRVILSE